MRSRAWAALHWASGSGLYLLDPGERKLGRFTGDVLLECDPRFMDFDGDGSREVVVPGRGRDHTSALGIALYRWTGDGYCLWWPDWKDLRRPYAICGGIVRPLRGHRLAWAGELGGR